MNRQKLRYVTYLIFSTLLAYSLSFVLFKVLKFDYLNEYSKGCLVYVVQYICFYILAKLVIKTNLRELINVGKIDKEYIVYFIVFLFISIVVNLKTIHLNTNEYPNAIKNILCVLLCVYFTSCCEEIVYRVILSKLICNRVLFIIISSILFSFAHGFSNGFDLFNLIYYFLFGVLLALITQSTKGYKTGIIIHSINNLVYSLIVTNNINDGPSLFVCNNNIKVVLLLLCVLIVVLFIKKKELWNI